MKILKKKGDFNEAVYERLKQIAKEKTLIAYSKLNEDCKLGLDFNDEKDRSELTDILGTIAWREVSMGRPMLSAVVVWKSVRPYTPADGFFAYADDLGLRQPGEEDRALWYRLLNACYEKWKDA
jgi:hypothetical protein